MLNRLLASLQRGRKKSELNREVEPASEQPLLNADDNLERWLASCNDAIACNELGERFAREGRKARAAACFQRCLELHHDFVAARFNLGNLFYGANQLDQAVEQYLAILELQEDNYHALNNMGIALLQSGESVKAVGCLRQALKLRPDFEEAGSNLLLALTVAPGVTEKELFEEHRQLPIHIERAMAERLRTFGNARDGHRRLRIGYMSADFKMHPVAFFLEPIVANHNGSQFEIFCYSNWRTSDATTEQLKKHRLHWRQINHLDDDAVASVIRQDAIDILVDLSGRTSGARLGVLARKPAPVQMTYLGYPNTTGLATVDYRITDSYGDPSGISEPYYVETLLRMPDCMWCYMPRADMPSVGELPAKVAGRITFGSFNNALKLNSDLIALWSRVLQAVPDSRMIIACLPEGTTRSRIRGEFSANGVSPDRIIMHGRMPAVRYWQLHNEADIALDAYPCNGGSTTCDSLWMGVPVITLCGSRFVSRAGYSILANVGLQQLVAYNHDQYVDIAAGLAGEQQHLADLRNGLRNQLAASTLCDARRFTENLEKLYREAWQTWCAS
jgi:protein O-GlcNAc transferase